MVRGGRRKRRTEAIWSPTCLPGTSAASPYLAPISGNSYNTHPLFRPRHCHDVPSGPRREPSPATLRGHAARLRACPHAALAAPKDVGRGASDGRQRGRGTEDESDAAGGSPSAGPHARKLKVGVPGWPLGAGAWAAWRAQPTASRPRPLGRVSDTIDAHSCAANRQGGRCHFLAIARPSQRLHRRTSQILIWKSPQWLRHVRLSRVSVTPLPDTRIPAEPPCSRLLISRLIFSFSPARHRPQTVEHRTFVHAKMMPDRPPTNAAPYDAKNAKFFHGHVV